MIAGSRIASTFGLAVCLAVLGCGDDVPDERAGTGDTLPEGTGHGDSSGAPGTDSTGQVDPDSTDGSESGSGTGEPIPEPLPPLSAAPLTTDERIEPVMTPSAEMIGDPRLPDDRQLRLADGLGDYELGPGEPIVDLTPDGSAPKKPGPNAALVARFVHLTDAQLADDESPTRVVDLDQIVGGGFRPEDHLGCNIVDAAVRTINRVHQDLPLDFVLLGGDNIDSAQSNELEWLLSVMDGVGPVHCDSGDDNDIEAGPGNDAKDPFMPVGLDVPWYWVSGNHDTLVQGNLVVANRLEAALSGNAPGGTRDWTQPGGPSLAGSVPADARRALLDQTSLLTRVSASGDGHGIDQAVIDRGEANYTFDVEGTELRFIVMDTSADAAGGANGLLADAEADGFLRPALDAAEADGKWVIVATHHASSALVSGSDEVLSTQDFRLLLGEYDNVLAHFAGHAHFHRALYLEPVGGHAYWEVVTSALMDFPNQMRVVEIHDQDNGEFRIQMVAFDYQVDDDPRGEEARALQILDHTTGWSPGGPGDVEDRNVSLYVPAP